MHLDEALQGHLVAAIVEVLLIDAGYQVIPTGIERSIRELRIGPPREGKSSGDRLVTAKACWLNPGAGK